MKRAGIGLSFAAALGLIACATEELDQPPPGGTAGSGSGGSHVGNGGHGGSSSGTPGGQANTSSGGHTNQGGTTGSIAGSSSSNAGMTGVGGLVGASGSIGLGGSVGSAGSGGSSPVFESGTCASSPSMSLSYQQASNNSKQITGRYQFINTTDTPIPLSDLKIRYFFSNEETSGWATAIYDQKLDGGTLGYRALTGTALAVLPLGTTVPGADSYIEVSFTSTLTIEKGAIGTVSWDLQPLNYNPPDQVQPDDYSYNAKAVAFTVWDHVVIYQGNTLVWGCTPKEAGGGSGGTAGVGGSGAGGSAVGGNAAGGNAGTGGSGTSGADNGGASGAGIGGTAGANAGAGGGTSNGGTSAFAGGAGSNPGGASGTGGAGGNPPSAGSGGSSGGIGGTSAI
ncbi:MAG TPA: cellulose binding domain-containing protein [Polyangiaceae bacterium]|nr:cellulose binding domain-containing protein [Polyangiaceae bacterium]